jgi:hypothetical protein
MLSYGTKHTLRPLALMQLSRPDALYSERRIFRPFRWPLLVSIFEPDGVDHKDLAPIWQYRANCVILTILKFSKPLPIGWHTEFPGRVHYVMVC